MYRVVEIAIFPVKGMGPIYLDRCAVEVHGLHDDRRYMLIDRDGNFVSQRSVPALALCTLRYAGDSRDAFVLAYKGEEITISTQVITTDMVETTIWSQRVEARLARPEINLWLSVRLGIDCRLVRLPSATSRIKHISTTGTTTPVSFADGYPILLVGTASLELLNSKLAIPVPMDRFRANIIVETEIPHEEDQWQTLAVGKAVLYHVKPCARCQVITIDQQNAVISKEPLTTLATYRRVDNAVLFGNNIIVHQHGQIAVGDPVVLR